MSFAHHAFFYRSSEQYAEKLGSFLTAGLDAGEPALVAVPTGRIELLRSTLGSAVRDVDFVDMERLGRNPSRIIGEVRCFVRDKLVDAARVRFVGEPIWPGRSPAEVLEATRHEALLNQEFAGAAATILCPYDATRLPAVVLANAHRTHPYIYGGEALQRSEAYVAPSVLLAEGAAAAPIPPREAATMVVGRDTMGHLRRFVASGARGAHVAEDRLPDLLLAVTEAATNAVEHGGEPATVSVWLEEGSFLCQIVSPGRIDDLLAGRHAPAPDADRGRGLWLINQLCDLVELRSGEWGTSLRLHTR